jgi:hypothetical protein
MHDGSKEEGVGFFAGPSLKKPSHVRFQVLTLASMKFRTIFWVVLPRKIIVYTPVK